MDKCPHCGSIGQMFRDCDNHHKGDIYCLPCGWRDPSNPLGKAAINLSIEGKHHTEEAKLKMSLAHTGRCLSEEHRESISLSLTGRYLTKEARANMSLAQMGRQCTKETRDKLRFARTGRSTSQVTRTKLSLISKALWKDPVYVKKIRKAIRKGMQAYWEKRLRVGDTG